MKTLKIGSALGAALALALNAASANAGVLVNAGFESGSLGPWTAAGGVTAQVIGSFFTTEGSNAVQVVPGFFFTGGSGTLSQSFSLSDAGLFEYAFDAGRSEGACLCNDVPMTFAFSIDGTVLESALPGFDVNSGGSAAATKLLSHYSGSVMLGAGVHDFTFAFSRGDSGFGRAPFFVVDGVQGGVASIAPPSGVGPIPEPASWAMMIVGFGLAGGAMRRRARLGSVA